MKSEALTGTGLQEMRGIKKQKCFLLWMLMTPIRKERLGAYRVSGVAVSDVQANLMRIACRRESHIHRDAFFSVAWMSRPWWKLLQSRFPRYPMKWLHSSCSVPEQLRQRLNGDVDTIQVSIQWSGSVSFNLRFYEPTHLWSKLRYVPKITMYPPGS